MSDDVTECYDFAMLNNTEIVELTEDLIDDRFLETLGNLSTVELDVEAARAVLRTRTAVGIHTYVALDGGRIVGSASLIVETKFLHGGGRVGHIEDVVVHADSQGKGIGKRLVDHATSEARAAGCYKTILACTPANKPFYEKCGYREHEIEMRCDL